LSFWNITSLTLEARGVPDLSAALAASAGIAIVADAPLAWLEDEQPGLPECSDPAEQALRNLL
jgi:hypothetical protein